MLSVATNLNFEHCFELSAYNRALLVLASNGTGPDHPQASDCTLDGGGLPSAFPNTFELPLCSQLNFHAPSALHSPCHSQVHIHATSASNSPSALTFISTHLRLFTFSLLLVRIHAVHIPPSLSISFRCFGFTLRLCSQLCFHAPSAMHSSLFLTLCPRIFSFALHFCAQLCCHASSALYSSSALNVASMYLRFRTPPLLNMLSTLFRVTLRSLECVGK